MPVLTFIDETTGDHRSLYVKNVGYGPALNIVRRIIKSGKSFEATAPEPLLLGSLGASEKVYAFHCTPKGFSSVIILDDPELHALIECDDVLDGHYKFTYQDRKMSRPEKIPRRNMPPTEAHRI